MAFFKNASGWISNDKEKTLDYKNQLSNVAPKDVQDGLKDLSTAVYNEVNKVVHGWNWTAKASRNAYERNPYKWICDTFPFGGVVATAIAIASNLPKMDVFFSFMITLMLFLALNPMDIISRFLSKQTRFFLVSDVLLFTAAIVSDSLPVMGATVVWAIITGLICCLMNKYWLMSHNWFNSETVRKALVQSPDNSGVKGWTDRGKVETRTVLAELGLPFNDNVLELFCKPVYIVGHYSAWFSTADDIKAKEEAEKKLAAANEKITELEANIEILKSEHEAYRINAEEKLNRAKVYESKINNLETQNSALAKQNEQLQDTNLQLMATSTIEAPEKTEREIMIEKAGNMDRQGMTLNQIHQALLLDGHKVSRSTVNNYVKKSRENAA